MKQYVQIFCKAEEVNVQANNYGGNGWRVVTVINTISDPGHQANFPGQTPVMILFERERGPDEIG